jgi:hypothetical protein
MAPLDALNYRMKVLNPSTRARPSRLTVSPPFGYARTNFRNDDNRARERKTRKYRLKVFAITSMRWSGKGFSAGWTARWTKTGKSLP